MPYPVETPDTRTTVGISTEQYKNTQSNKH